MENILREKTKELLYYFLSMKKNIDNQSKILNIQEKDLFKLESFDKNSIFIDFNRYPNVDSFVNGKRSEKDIFLSKGLIVDKETKKKYPFILKRCFEKEDKIIFYNESIEFQLESLPKRLSSDFELIELKKQFNFNSFLEFKDTKLKDLINLLKIRINKVGKYYIEEGYFLVKKNKDNKLIYDEFTNIINNLNNYDRLPRIFNHLLDDNAKGEVACSLDSESKVQENILIEGPAGCGKSEKVLELAVEELKKGKRVLITSLKDSSLRSLEGRFLKDIRPLIFSVYNEQSDNKDYKVNLEEINKRSSIEIDRLKDIIDNLEKSTGFNNKYASSLNKRLYKYGVEAIELIEEVNYKYLDIAYRKSDVLIDIPSKDELVNKINEFKSRKSEIAYHFEILKNWKIKYETNYDEKNLIYTINYGKSLINEIKGTYAEKLLLENNSDEFIDELIMFISSTNKNIHTLMKALEISGEKEDTFTEEELKLIETRVSSLGEEASSSKEKEHFYLSMLKMKEKLIDEFNMKSSDYGYNEIKYDQIYLISHIFSRLNIFINWNSNVKAKIKKYLGNISFCKDMKLNTLEELDNVVVNFISLKEVNKYFEVLNYIEKLKMYLYVEEDFKELYLAIKELNTSKVEEQYIFIDTLKKFLPNVMKLKSYLNKLYDVLQIPIDKMFKVYKTPKEQWSAILKELRAYVENGKYNHNYIQKNTDSSNDKMLSVLKSWYYFLKEYKQEKYDGYNQWINGGKSKFDEIKSMIRLCIMPINKVLELVPANEEAFDIVIIEDCNQCEIAYLSLLLRGKKFIITGDEKQYIPQFSGIDKRIIENNLKVYLKNNVNFKEFNYFNNLYDLLKKYTTSRIKLDTQHRFNRSITNLLNENFYNDTIKCNINDNPKFKAINSIKVDEATRERDKIVNYKEAAAIVNEIIKCTRNPIYDNKTIGVISLLGAEQGEVIKRLLQEKLSAAELEKRKIVCGDFYCLQGEERDLIFLSMVVGNNVKFIAQTKENDYKRFNHALSRAREQLWLFHSVNLRDINKDCIRYKILQYFIEEKTSKVETA
ncbi:MAG: DEAD/DEAH box helicase [Clostridiaceae bacterium]